MLPKVRSAADVVALDLLVTQVERSCGLPVGHIGIEAQIETTGGLINVEEICAASPRLETIIFGPADFAASMEMPVLTGGVAIPEYPGDHFNYVFSKILMAGRANGLQVIDGPFLKVRELDSLREFSQRTRVLGYDGKWALTPDQVTRAQRGLLTHPGAVRQGVGHPRRLPQGDRGRPRGCGHVRRRDDRRGVAGRWPPSSSSAASGPGSPARRAETGKDRSATPREAGAGVGSEGEVAVPLVEHRVVAVHVDRAERRPVVEGELEV